MTDQLTAKLSDDRLEGAEHIAEYLYGDRNKRRKVYALVERGNRPKPPIFKMGGQTLYAYRSSLRRWVEEQERRASEPR